MDKIRGLLSRIPTLAYVAIVGAFLGMVVIRLLIR